MAGGFFKKIFSGPDVVKTAMEGVRDGIDTFTFTEQERAHVDAGVRDFLLKYLEATQPQNLARRYIAFGIVGLWMLLVLTAVVAAYWSSVDGSYSDFVFSVLEEHVNTPFMGIMGFYFLTHLARSYQREKKE